MHIKAPEGKRQGYNRSMKKHPARKQDEMAMED
jgi:hypothetical protein